MPTGQWVVVVSEEDRTKPEALLCSCWAEAHEVCREADLAGLISDAMRVWDGSCGIKAVWGRK